MSNQRLIECVPNFSEGQNMEVIQQIAASISAITGVQLLDVDPWCDQQNGGNLCWESRSSGGSCIPSYQKSCRTNRYEYIKGSIREWVPLTFVRQFLFLGSVWKRPFFMPINWQKSRRRACYSCLYL